MTDKKKELLLKLKNLAERGVGGERETAERKLQQLIEKYGIDEEELSGDQTVDFEFYYKDEWERKLLRQLFYRMFGMEYANKAFVYKWGKGSRSIYGVTCTKAEGVQLQIEYDFYKKLYYEELDIFQKAFVQKHSLFPDSSGSDREYTEEEKQEFARIFQMMEGLSDKSFNPQIEENC